MITLTVLLLALSWPHEVTFSGELVSVSEFGGTYTLNLEDGPRLARFSCPADDSLLGKLCAGLEERALLGFRDRMELSGDLPALPTEPFVLRSIEPHRVELGDPPVPSACPPGSVPVMNPDGSIGCESPPDIVCEPPFVPADGVCVDPCANGRC